MKRLLAVLALSTLGLTPLYGKDVYRWVDDKGRVHLSDEVPEQYRKSATRIDTRQFELTPQQKKEAAERAARERTLAAQAAASAAKSKASAQPAANGPTVSSGTSRSDCATLRQRYKQSADCYAPFLNANGSIKPGALQACGPPVPVPAAECSSTPAY